MILVLLVLLYLICIFLVLVYFLIVTSSFGTVIKTHCYFKNYGSRRVKAKAEELLAYHYFL
jgi:LytS/YehU family sensor histidine kinase